MNPSKKVTWSEKLNCLIGMQLNSALDMVTYVLICECNISPKKEELASVLKQFTIYYYDEDKYPPENYDYIKINLENYTSIQLGKFLFDFRSSNIILEGERSLKKPSIMNLLMGTICSSPYSMAKHCIKPNYQPCFAFKGNVLLLTELNHKEFKKKFVYLEREMIIC